MITQTKKKERIHFTWSGNAERKYFNITLPGGNIHKVNLRDTSDTESNNKSFKITATKDKLFMVVWGDDTPIEIFTGTGDFENISHIYPNDDYYSVSIIARTADCLFTQFECFYNQVIDIDISECLSLEWLNCSFNELTNLDTDNNSTLFFLSCSNNHLELSDLYNATKTINARAIKQFGNQTSIPEDISIGDSVDFSAQKEFGGISTIFSVIKEGLPASQNDYSIIDGIITFKKAGEYTVTMTNEAIVCDINFPAKVNVKVYVL